MGGNVSERDWRRLLTAIETVRASRRSGGVELGKRQEVAELLAGLDGSLARDVYAPLIARIAAGPITLAQLGQSVDGRIATETGDSHYVNGDLALDHLHRLRALFDVVVIGATTAEADDPQLTTRRVVGNNPARAIIDPNGRVAPSRRVFRGEARCLVMSFASKRQDQPPSMSARRLELAAHQGRIQPREIIAALHAEGLTAILVEGGSQTVSTFFAAGVLDRLHLLVAPLVLGSGKPAFGLPPVARIAQATRLSMRAHPLGDDLLLDCVPSPR